MKEIKKKVLAVLVAALIIAAIPLTAAAATDEVSIVLSDSGTTVDGEDISTDSSSAVYEGADIVYYPDGTDSEFGEGTDDEKYTQEEAAAQTVITITQAGTYRVSGTLSAGQLAIDLGEDAAADPDAVVTLILDNVSIICDIAPAVIFYNVYECGSHDTEGATGDVDTTAAGANVIIADGSVNNITGSYVARIYATDTTPKIKYDGAFYSVMSMNIDGESAGTGVLNIVADNEGLDSELHLTINGGNINIFAQDDGINTNEDYVSVTTINGGNLHIVGGLGQEGDGIDSNGWLIINGGTVISTANPAADSGLDADMGVYVNGGTVVALGSTMDWAESDSDQVTMNLQFASMQSQDDAIVITDTEGNIIFAYDPDMDEITGSYLRNYQGAVISCPSLEVGETYYVYIGGTIAGVDEMGVFDVSTITSYTDGVQQMYTGTDVGGVMGPGGEMPGDWNGEMPEDWNGDGEWSEDDFTPPEGQMPDDDMAEGQRPDDEMNNTESDGTGSVYFYMTDKVNAFSGVTAATNNTDTVFTDVSESDWFYNSVYYCLTNGLMNGTSDTTFEPYTPVSRSMMATLLYRLAGSPEVSGESSFEDVDAGQWYTDAIIWATENGIVQGYGDGYFGTADNVTRQDMVTMLYRFAEKYGYDLSASDDLAGYADADDVSDYAMSAMQWAVGAEIVQGSDTGLEPTGTAQRCQIAAILERFCELG